MSGRHLAVRSSCTSVPLMQTTPARGLKWALCQLCTMLIVAAEDGVGIVDAEAVAVRSMNRSAGRR